MATTWTAPVHVKTVKRGVSGVTDIPGPTRMRTNWNLEKRVGRGGNSRVPSSINVLGGTPQIQVEGEDFDTVLAIVLALNAMEKLVTVYVNTAGADKTLTALSGKFTALGASEFPPREGGGKVPLQMFTFDVCEDTPGSEKTIADLITVT